MTKEPKNKEGEAVRSGDNRRPDGTFGKDNTANLDGRPKETEEDKIQKKAIQEYIAEFKESLAPVLEIIPPKLQEGVEAGNLQAMKEVIDILVSKAPQKQDLEVKVIPFDDI